ncbi:polysaccharide biosynthesis tyrosine autokinase [Gordonia amicalis]|uniref:polysaccharide biosynthesis tyrosine autokinase n=1 Tax=Gordonia amicalis TaxID=89053 RepID=UPI001EDCEA9A|nr:polysaccharide biosynthesis tyrosine autokinase [Gordonia amicalis]UKO93382.1 polysaccharide biosynthesis tyrosine autokinase [Gordonia amicalis]
MDVESTFQQDGGRRFDSLHSFADEVRAGWWIVVIGGLLGAIAGCVVSFAMTPLYSSSATMYVTSGSDGDSQSAYQGSLASQQRVASYARLVTSDAIIEEALQSAPLPITAEEAKEAIVASATPQTVLLSIKATDEDPLIAATLVNAVAKAMASYVTTLETPSLGGEPLAKMTVVTPGTVETEPVSPRVKQNVLIGFVVGLAAALVVILARMRFGTQIRSSEDVEAIFGAGALGVVSADDALVNADIIDFHGGLTGTAEQYRKIRTNLTFANVDNSVRTILVSSPSQSEGKTTTSLNLAASLADLGKKVVLVDADLRRPAVASRLSGLNASVGLTDYLRDAASVGDLLQTSTVPGLDILTSGALPPNPAELLGSRRMGQLVSELGTLYDYVILDSPPVLPVTDAVVVSQWVDGAIVVVRAELTRREELESALTQLRASRVAILGVVLNGVSVNRREGQYSYYSADAKLLSKSGPSRSSVS